MEIFKDSQGKNVHLSFKRDSFSKKPEHVLVICRYNGEWLLTKHKARGLEFPGGKRENNETLEEAAYREVKEETGAVLKDLIYIGEYEVKEVDCSFVKAIYYGVVAHLENEQNYYETDGPVLVDDTLLETRFSSHYSFIMKDLVIEKSIHYIMEMCP